jgi:hypothetical protein
MELTCVGNPTIEKPNTYSENQTIRVRAILDLDTTLTSFSGIVAIAEQNTTIYEENGGILPASVTIPDDQTGCTTFVAKSIAGPETDYTTPPGNASVRATDYTSYPASVAQWVDVGGNDRVDWCEQWSDDILASYQERTDEVGLVTRQVMGIQADDYDPDASGSTWTGEDVFHVNPAGPGLRTDQGRALHGTVLHESRHVFQFYDCSRTGFPGMTDNEHDTHEDPDNDDDPLWRADDGDWLPEVVFFDSEAGPNSILDGDATNPNGSQGDVTFDPMAGVVKIALQSDANEFEDDFKHLD